MKKILFLLVMLPIIGCSTDDETQQGNVTTETDCTYISADEFYYGANSSSIKKYNKEGKILIEEPITPPSDKSISLPYGETQTLTYHKPQLSCIVNNKIFLLWNPENFYAETTEPVSEIQSYNEELKLIKKREFINITKILNFGEDVLIKYFGLKYEIVNSDLITQREGIIDQQYEITDNTKYIKENIIISFYEDNLVLYSLDEGILWNYNVKEYIQSLFPSETQYIKIETTEMIYNKGFIQVQLKLTFYNGSNKNISLKLSMEGEIIKS